MIVNVPVPAVEGENVPLLELVIPVPLQVPPAGDADKLKLAAETQADVGVVMLTVGKALTVTVTGARYVPGQIPTQYVVVALNTGVVKVDPVPSCVPPIAALYQVMVPAGGFPPRVAVSVTDPLPQTAVFVALIVKKVMVALFIPGQPLVAPLGVNSLNAPEFVTPLFPPLVFLVGVPDETAIYPPPPPPPGPSASFPFVTLMV